MFLAEFFSDKLEEQEVINPIKIKTLDNKIIFLFIQNIL